MEDLMAKFSRLRAITEVNPMHGDIGLPPLLTGSSIMALRSCSNIWLSMSTIQEYQEHESIFGGLRLPMSLPFRAKRQTDDPTFGLREIQKLRTASSSDSLQSMSAVRWDVVLIEKSC